MKEVIEELLEKNKNRNNISFDSCIIIHGKSGIGKTYKINKILEELNIEIVKFTSKDINGSKDFEDLLIKTITVNNFMSVISCKTLKKKNNFNRWLWWFIIIR